MAMFRKLAKKEMRVFFGKDIPIVQRHIIDKELIQRLSNNIKIMSHAFDDGHSCRLIFYVRDHNEGWFEAGLIYVQVPKGKGSRSFSEEMLRFFSKKKKHCRNLADQYYFELILKKSFDCQN